MIFENGAFIFSDGVKFHAYNGIIGLSPNDSGVYEGYDGYLFDQISLTPEHKKELADYMIELWTKWRNGELSGPIPDPLNDILSKGE